MSSLPLIPLLALAACGDGGAELVTSYPPAGEDRFERTRAVVEIEVTLPGAGALSAAISQLETVELEGPMVVKRGDPQDADGDGLAEVETEIVSMELRGTSSFGELIVRVSPNLPSRGLVKQQLPGQDFPAGSFFGIYLEVEIPGLNLTLHNDNEHPIRMEAVLSSLPPGEGDEDGQENVYRLSTGLAVPLIEPSEAALRVGRIADALHIPNPAPGP